MFVTERAKRREESRQQCRREELAEILLEILINVLDGVASCVREFPAGRCRGCQHEFADFTCLLRDAGLGNSRPLGDVHLLRPAMQPQIGDVGEPGVRALP